MRESLESVSSPLSPTNHGSECCSADFNSVTELNFKTEADLDDLDQHLLHAKTENSDAELILVAKENSVCQMDGTNDDHSGDAKEIIEEVDEGFKEVNDA